MFHVSRFGEQPVNERDTVITTVQAVMSADKSTIQLQFMRRNGLTSYINIAANGGPTFLRDLSQALAAVGRKDGDDAGAGSSGWLAPS